MTMERDEEVGSGIIVCQHRLAESFSSSRPDTLETYARPAYSAAAHRLCG